MTGARPLSFSPRVSSHWMSLSLTDSRYTCRGEASDSRIALPVLSARSSRATLMP